jgi:hypothetical protein
MNFSFSPACIEILVSGYGKLLFLTSELKALKAETRSS